MKRALSLLLLGVLSGAAVAQGPTPRDYTKAEVVEAAEFCLEAIRELEANTQRFPIEEFGNPLPNETPNDLLTSCVLYRLKNGNAEIVPLS